MNGDLGLQQNITGLNPDQTKHSSAFVIQPESGLPLSLSVKMQINMHFKDLSNFPAVSKFSHLTAPMLWFEIMMPKLPDSLDSRFNFYLNILPLVNSLCFWTCLFLGIALILSTISRATIKMSSHVRGVNISEGKYARTNLCPSIVGGVTNKVYSPCEMKLIDDISVVEQLTIEESTRDSAFQLLRQESTYALEVEPALFDFDHVINLSSNSTTYSSCSKVGHCNDENDISV
ncbi:sensory neuron membrane protein 1-like isoform X2 [Drosophila eugracilis]|uniref:sensory neuron membrane protein 1-like isoform X1 n=1 Tax=Drosophila eugracilis TaxID=29029 RepID=UPI0007E68A45|nr:sensory neuron membrane protein 1-like isoform X1 [Drosophila eugracilis]XP_017067298.1 sensory neuron membrane protein 1-like isoform X2 [Drosophila eugracilis]